MAAGNSYYSRAVGVRATHTKLYIQLNLKSRMILKCQVNDLSFIIEQAFTHTFTPSMCSCQPRPPVADPILPNGTPRAQKHLQIYWKDEMAHQTKLNHYKKIKNGASRLGSLLLAWPTIFISAFTVRIRRKDKCFRILSKTRKTVCANFIQYGVWHSIDNKWDKIANTFSCNI